MRAVRAFGAFAIAVGLLAGCASVVNGTGSTNGSSGASGAPSGSNTPDFPSASLGAPSGTAAPSGSGGAIGSSPVASASSGAVAAGLVCPTITDPRSQLSFSCLTASQTSSPAPLWPVMLIQKVEATGWVLEEGSALTTAPSGISLATVAQSYRARMIAESDYLPGVKANTVASKASAVDGRPAYLLQSMMVLDTAQAAKRGTKVKEEQLWLIAIQVDASHISIWHISVPDLVKAYWAKVPAVIASIKVG